MIEHLNNFKRLINQLKKVELKLDDEIQALLRLSSLSESWETLVVTLNNSALGRRLTRKTITDSLLNKEARRKERGISMQSEPTVTEHRDRNEKRRRNNGQGRSMGRSKSRSQLVCQAIRNLIVEISKEIRRPKKSNQIKSNTEEKRRALLLLLPKITIRFSSLEKKIM